MRVLSHLRTRGENYFHAHVSYGSFVLIGTILMLVLLLLLVVETVH